MNELEEKLSSLLSDPQMMQQITAMMQAFSVPPKSQIREDTSQSNTSNADILKNLSTFVEGGNIAPEQKYLLQALKPYLNQSRIRKLERAMQAAKMAEFAASILKNGNSRFSGGY